MKKLSILLALILATSCQNKTLKLSDSNFNAGVSIENETSYEMDITANGTGTCTGTTKIQPNGIFTCAATYTADGSHNTLAIIMYKNGSAIMQGNLAFSQLGGVYFDRGWLPANAQIMKGVINANDQIFTQTTNGGQQVLQWNQFENGGGIKAAIYNQ